MRVSQFSQLYIVPLIIISSCRNTRINSTRNILQQQQNPPYLVRGTYGTCNTCSGEPREVFPLSFETSVRTPLPSKKENNLDVRSYSVLYTWYLVQQYSGVLYSCCLLPCLAPPYQVQLYTFLFLSFNVPGLLACECCACDGIALHCLRTPCIYVSLYVFVLYGVHTYIPVL